MLAFLKTVSLAPDKQRDWKRSRSICICINKISTYMYIHTYTYIHMLAFLKTVSLAPDAQRDWNRSRSIASLATHDAGISISVFSKGSPASPAPASGFLKVPCAPE